MLRRDHIISLSPWLKIPIKALNIHWGFAAVAVMMVVGNLIHSRNIAETMSKKITAMNHGQGFSANLSTGILVIIASVFGLPVSTTHVAVGSLFGIDLVSGKANPKVMTGTIEQGESGVKRQNGLIA
jgi:PiT family inorganic phosphate transporter